jgi:uncharacterized protein
MKHISLALVVLLTLFFAQRSRAQDFPEVTIRGSQVRTLKSASTGRTYDLYIRLPAGYDKDKSAKYPVLYILDGQWDFKLMDSVVGGLVYDKFVPPLILVGITYSGKDADYGSLRAIDDTPVPSPTVIGSGDGPKFHKFFKSELIPFVEANYRADSSRRILQGSSYAGLFTLYALFSDPGLFWGYVAASPAVPYGDNYSFKQEGEYARTHNELPVKLYLAVGGAEELSAPVQEFMRVIQSRVYKGLKIQTRVVEGERHAGNKPEIFNRGLRFLFSE